MSEQLAFVFPGQGSQKAGMGAALAETFPSARRIFAEADEVLGEPLSTLCFAGPDEQLAQTANTQPAILTCSVAAWTVLREETGLTPTVCLGHSLGEFSALVAAGALEFADAVRLVRLRGRAMQDAVPAGVGAMAAILGGDDAQIAQVCAEVAGNEVVAPANFNSPGQLVIAGHAAAVDRALARLAELGVKKAVKLPVSVPSHCALMREAADRLGERMAALAWSAPTIPVVQNAEARPYTEVAEIRAALQRQLYLPVRWTECVQSLAAAGITRLAECGPGKVLAGLTKRIDKSLEARAIGAPADLAAALTDWRAD